ncbi:MAG: DUF1449 family protein [Planctomycetes bacterium]|nr:DUF1449 family protein [Planctomycetota bacterium]
MIEFLQFAFLPATAVFSLLLGVVLLYWLVVIVGLLDTDFLNIDLHTDGDLGDVGDAGDVDVDADVDVGEAGDLGDVFHAMLSFFYVGRIPVTVLVTLMVFSLWILAMAANHAVNPTGGLLLGLPIAAGSFVASLFVVKVLGWPFAKLYRAMDGSRDGLKNVTGKLCVLLTAVGPGRTGQAQVATAGAPAVVNVIVEDGVTLERGSEAVVLEYRKASHVYVVAPVDLNAPARPVQGAG